MPLLHFCYIRKRLGRHKRSWKALHQLQTTFSRHWRWRGIPPKHHFSRRPAIRLATSLRCSISRLLLRTRSVLEANVLSLSFCEIQSSIAPLKSHQHPYSSESHNAGRRAKPLLLWSICETVSMCLCLLFFLLCYLPGVSTRIMRNLFLEVCVPMFQNYHLFSTKELYLVWPEVRSRGPCY